MAPPPELHRKSWTVAFKKRTPRRGAMKLGTFIFTLPATPPALWPPHYTRAGHDKSPRPIPQERGSKAPVLELIQQNSHSRHLDPPGLAPLPLGILACSWVGQAALLPGKDRIAQTPRGPPLGTPVPWHRGKKQPLHGLPTFRLAQGGLRIPLLLPHGSRESDTTHGWRLGGGGALLTVGA